jgi:ribosomal protein L40E
MPETSPAPRAKNLDIECLRCGARNIPENKICGRCGANLPLVYDELGKIVDWKQDPYYKAIFKEGGKGGAPQIDRIRWLLRMGILMGAVLIALYILRHH